MDLRKLKKLIKKEDGAVLVIVAVSLSVLLGFTALAVDFGRLASTKQSAQNAADAAALAAAQDLGRGKGIAVITETGDKYCRLNGFDPEDPSVEVEMQVNGKTVSVNIIKTLDMGFSQVLTGQQTRSVSAAAVAEATSIFGDCPYAMFAGQRIEDDGQGINITGNDITINGNIHSNSDITMRNAVLAEGAIATAVRNVVPSTEGWNSNSIAMDMPSFKSFESALSGMQTVIEFPGNVTKSSKDGFASLIGDAVSEYSRTHGGDDSYLYNGLYIHVGGNLTFNGNSSTAYNVDFPIILIVDGNIDLNGAPINSSRDYPVSIMSAHGDITVNGGGADYTGIIFAPEGDITLNGNGADFLGMIVGQNIRKSGGKIVVSYYEDADRYLPTTKVHLIY